jgi:hypothetical protein
MAYEWQFLGVHDVARVAGRPPVGVAGGGRPPGATPPAGVPPPPPASQGTMTPEQVRLSALLAPLFPAYVNGLGLRGRGGEALTLDAAGNGPFKDHVKAYLAASARHAIASGKDVSAASWLTIREGRVQDVDVAGYARSITRMKVTPAFDAVDLSSPENDLFGEAATRARHFTDFSHRHTTRAASLADSAAVRMMNPMAYIGSPQAATAKHWRIRHGSLDRDTSLAIPVILATKLENMGRAVDAALPWGQGHGGDYDLADLFDWIGRATR